MYFLRFLNIPHTHPIILFVCGTVYVHIAMHCKPQFFIFPQCGRIILKDGHYVASWELNLDVKGHDFSHISQYTQ